MIYRRLRLQMIHLDAVDSTNNYAANLLKETNVAQGTAILTKGQHSGKGQRGNSWHSEVDKNLLFSLVLFPDVSAQHIFYLNVITSLAVRAALDQVGIPAKVKWPNDIYVGERKIAGILIESQLQGSQIRQAIVGVGLNVNQTNFETLDHVTSCLNELGESLDLNALFLRFYSLFDRYYDQFLRGQVTDLKKEYYRYLFGYEEQWMFQIGEQRVEGVIKGISETGLLRVLIEGKEEQFDLKEIAFVR